CGGWSRNGGAAPYRPLCVRRGRRSSRSAGSCWSSAPPSPRYEVRPTGNWSASASRTCQPLGSTPTDRSDHAHRRGPRPAAPRGSRARDPNGRSELHEGGAPAAPRPAPVRAAGRVVRRRAGQRAGRAARGARREVGMSRGRVGVLVPPANPSAEPELTRLLGSRADMHVSRFPVRPGLAPAERLEGYNAALPAMARSFGDLALDALIMACDGPRYLLDPDEDLDECERMSERFGVPFATATVAVMEAIEHLGVDEVHIVSPFQPWLTELAER